MRILVINPGSTSTKMAVVENGEPLLIKVIRHAAEELAPYARIIDQFDFRRQMILGELEAAGIPVEFDAVVARGGLTKPVAGGVYAIDENMIQATYASDHQHACDLGCVIAREIAKGLGVKETVNGMGTVAEALGNEALALEKAKSNVLGAWLCAQEAEAYNISALFQKEDVLTTFVTNTIRSTRFGAADPTGIANIFVYNYLLESKAIVWNASGRYSIDYDKTWQALESLGAMILDIQAHGDLAAAHAALTKYGVAGPESLSDKRVLESAGIPVDIRFTYE